ncbi:hypothetical protein MDAP_000179 [Mitosporidium daphniae]
MSIGCIGSHRSRALNQGAQYISRRAAYSAASVKTPFRIVPISPDTFPSDTLMKKPSRPQLSRKKSVEKQTLKIVPITRSYEMESNLGSNNFKKEPREASSVNHEEQPFPLFHEEGSSLSSSQALDFPIFESISKEKDVEPEGFVPAYEPGDLIEIVVQKSRHILGIVLSVGQENTNLLYALNLTNKQSMDDAAFSTFSLQQVMSFNVRFKAKRWLFLHSNLTPELIDNIFSLKTHKTISSQFTEAALLSLNALGKALKTFESNSFRELQRLLQIFTSFEREYLDRPSLSSATSARSSRAPVSMLVRGLSPEEFLLESEKIASNCGSLSRPISIESLHAAYRFLFCNSKYFVKPPFLGPTGPYFMRPPAEIAKINSILSLPPPQIEQFREKLRAHLNCWHRSTAANSVAGVPGSCSSPSERPSHNVGTFFTSETDQLLLWALQRYACSHKYNLMGINGHPLADVAIQCLSGILDTGNEAGDLYPTLEKRGLLPPDHNVHWEQSCLQYEIPAAIEEAASKAISLDSCNQSISPQSLKTSPVPISLSASPRKILPDGSSLESRIEFGHSHLAIAIDSADTTEVDDALSVDDTTEADTYWGVHVHVADPTAFIPMGSTLERWCAQRTSSIYVPEAKAPMLPETMLEPISLGGKKALTYEPLAFTFSFQVDKSSGEILNHSAKIRPSILRNVQRLTYEDADALLQPCDSTSPLPSTLLSQLAQVANALARARGNIEGASFLSFIQNRPSPEVRLEGPVEAPASVIRIINSNDQSSVSRRIVSELMVAAGVVAARVSQELSLPVPYRRQDPPKAGSRLDALAERIESVLKIEKQMSPLIRDIVGSHLVSTSGILAPSKVSLVAGVHWSMGLNAYLRVTSPMRRYADMLIHYQLKAALGGCGSSNIMRSGELISRLRDVNELEPQLKSLQRRATRFWLLTYILRQPADKIWDAIVLGGSQPSQTVSAFTCQIYILELYSSFSITIDSYMLSALGIASFQEIMVPGTQIQVTAGVVKRDLNQASWHLAAIGNRARG